mmetsp:Transcript_14358/g.44402  ORF Transcript_14358/g.44402 Transcript_14358/m.44402 type:complete len:205 (+) Transcript_14358:1-615(+)
MDAWMAAVSAARHRDVRKATGSRRRGTPATPPREGQRREQQARGHQQHQGRAVAAPVLRGRPAEAQGLLQNRQPRLTAIPHARAERGALAAAGPASAAASHGRPRLAELHLALFAGAASETEPQGQLSAARLQQARLHAVVNVQQVAQAKNAPACPDNRHVVLDTLPQQACEGDVCGDDVRVGGHPRLTAKAFCCAQQHAALLR